MPQFDFSHYVAQIFWFLLCFSALYVFIACVIIPRVRGVLTDRKSVIDKALDGLEKVDKQISDVEGRSKATMKEADEKYKDFIVKAMQESKDVKEKCFDKFKKDSDELLFKSKSQIDKIVKESGDKSEKISLEIASFIEGKILN